MSPGRILCTVQSVQRSNYSISETRRGVVTETETDCPTLVMLQIGL